jgi:hypothetical protein
MEPKLFLVPPRLTIILKGEERCIVAEVCALYFGAVSSVETCSEEVRNPCFLGPVTIIYLQDPISSQPTIYLVSTDILAQHLSSKFDHYSRP